MRALPSILFSLALAGSVCAAPSNEVDEAREPQQRRGDSSPEKREEMHERRLQLMEKSLDEIGVTEEQREKVIHLQALHREKMHENFKRVAAAREKLSVLQNTGADKEALDQAIEAVSDAQTEQLRILVHNRMEMERILGPEKYAQFMERARRQFRKHGRRGGSGLPPRPGLPPTPSQGPVSPPDRPPMP